MRQISETAVLHANYLMRRLQKSFYLPYDRHCMHEFVLSGMNQKAFGIRTLDIAKRLLAHGIHAPTVYFPLIVDEAIMVEPTETETKETLDRFIDAMYAIAAEAEANPDLLKDAPHSTPIGRLDEAAAARRPVVRWEASVEDEA